MKNVRAPETTAAISETELVARVREMCDSQGLYAFHLYSYRVGGASGRPGSSAGFPDWVVCGRGGFLFRECKSAEGRSSMAQIRWGRAIKAAGGNYAVWRPDDLASGLIARELQQLANPGA
jgi:hypothetical protein